MIRLEIYPEGQTTPLVPNISPEMSFEMIRENPQFNQRGDYTYDIDISLRDPHNRKIYEHIDRLTSNSYPKGRKVRIICGGNTVCEGKEVILRKEDDNVKVQVLSGNSELNFLTADDNLRIREMNFGTFSAPTNEKAASSAFKLFPEANYVFPMCVERSSGDEADIYVNECYYDTRVSGMVYETGTVLRPMPFVLYLVEKFIEALGYHLRSNALRDIPKWCKLLMIHGYNTLSVQKMLPDWTAAEFISYIEAFFNCIFIVDEQSKEVDIRTFHSMQTNPTIKVIKREEVIDDFLREYDGDDVKFTHNYERVEYNLPGGEYWKRTNLDPTVENLCTKLEASYSQAEAMPISECQWKIFHYSNDDIEFVRVNEVIPYYSETGTPVYRRYAVNQYKPYGESGEANVLKVIPVEVIMYERTGRICPISELRETMEDVAFKDAIGSNISEDTVDNLQVCFYSFDGTGFNIDFNGSQAPVNFPVPQCVTTRNYFHQTFGTSIFIPRYTGVDDMTLELNGVHGLVNTVYATGQNIDVTQKHTIYFKSNGILNPNDLYNIAGKLFICQQLKFTFQNGKRHPVVEGVFYPYTL